ALPQSRLCVHYALPYFGVGSIGFERRPLSRQSSGSAAQDRASGDDSAPGHIFNCAAKFGAAPTSIGAVTTSHLAPPFDALLHLESPPTIWTELKLLDLLVGAQHDGWGYRKAERRGGFAVHEHLEFCRKLHRKIARLFAAQDAIHIGGGATKGVYLVGSVGEQAAVPGKGRLRIDRRDVASGR